MISYKRQPLLPYEYGDVQFYVRNSERHSEVAVNPQCVTFQNQEDCLPMSPDGLVVGDDEDGHIMKPQTLSISPSSTGISTVTSLTLKSFTTLQVAML